MNKDQLPWHSKICRMGKQFSSVSILFLTSISIVLATHFLYYPKWTMKGTESTISWDASGYYMYLPAIFIYKDLKQCKFKDEVLRKYNPTPDFQQAYIHEGSGNHVMKYSIGNALILSPFFALGHLWALYDSRYPPDGFSLPYQFFISMGSLVLAVLGLLMMRKVLCQFFKPKVVDWAILLLVIGTNYLNYSAIDGAMTHNTLFTIYAMLIWFSIKFHNQPSTINGIAVGLLVGVAALVRPTEFIACLIPILWGINPLNLDQLKGRLMHIRDHWTMYLLSIIITALIGMIQLGYWKYVSGEWIVYSYQDQGFSWLKPHLINGIFSYRSGWLIYSPLMIFALIGFYYLYRAHRSIFYASFIFFLLFTYIAFAWDIWWYGGSLGQRTMVQLYPILLFPLSAAVAQFLKSNHYFKWLFALLSGLFIYANLWFTHQAHRGGLLHVGHMTKPYFFATLFTFEHDSENLKLLDHVNSLYKGKRENIREVYADSTSLALLDQSNQFAPRIQIASDRLPDGYDWLRVKALFTISQKEWDFWRMTQFIVKFYNVDEQVQHSIIRIQRHMNDNQTKELYLDIPRPTEHFTDMYIEFWNADGNKQIEISNITVEAFDEP